MSETHVSEAAPAGVSREDKMSVSFAQLVMQQANMATMFLGRVPHPESGQVIKDLDTARMFIDQLEMLEIKTRGNLDKDEAALLKQSLMSLRLAFVDAADAASEAEAKPEAALAESAPAKPAAAPSEEEHRTKFSKKY